MSDDPNQVTPGAEGSDQETSAKLSFTKDEILNIVKSNQHGREHIGTLEEENKQYREQINKLQEELSASKSMSELMAELRETNIQSDPSGLTAPQVDENALLAKLEQQVFDRMNAQQQEAVLESNWNSVEGELRQKHGDRFDSYVSERASELGMSPEQMVQMGATTPQAFLQLMGGDRKSTVAPTTPSNERAPIGSGELTLDQQIAKVASAKKDLDTPEGRDANRLWKDPEWQRKMRQQIIDEAREKGSQFGNFIR